MKTCMAILMAAGMAAAVSSSTWAEPPAGGGPRALHRGQPGERMKAMDKDGDGKVTWDEFKAYHDAHLRERFDALDTNKDGVLSRDDMQGRGPRAGTPPRAEAPAANP